MLFFVGMRFLYTLTIHPPHKVDDLGRYTSSIKLQKVRKQFFI